MVPSVKKSPTTPQKSSSGSRTWRLAARRVYGLVGGEDAVSQLRAQLQLFSLLGFLFIFNFEGFLDKNNFVCTNRGVFLKEVSKLLAVQFIAQKSPDVNT